MRSRAVVFAIAATSLSTLACEGAGDVATREIIKAGFCDAIKDTKLDEDADLKLPDELPTTLLACMHPAGTLDSSEVHTTLTACTDPENWEMSSEITLHWTGLLGKVSKTQVHYDRRIAGGYVSERTTKVFDEGTMPAPEACTDGEWKQSDEKVIDLEKLVKDAQSGQ